TIDGEAAECAHERAKRRPEQLGLRHEAELPPREDAECERPAVGVRQMVRCEHRAAFDRDVLAAAPGGSEEEAHHRIAHHADERVERQAAARQEWLPRRRGRSAIPERDSVPARSRERFVRCRYTAATAVPMPKAMTERG